MRTLLRSRATAVMAALLLTLTFQTGVRAAPIPWDGKAALFEYTAHGEDVRDTLRKVLELNGIDGVIFRPGVKGEVNFAFTNMPLEAAFNKLVEENGLDSRYDPTNRTVTIFPVANAERRKLIGVKQIPMSELKASLYNFGVLKDAEFKFDPAHNVVMVRGAPGMVSEIEGIIARLDQAHGERLAARDAAIAALNASNRNALDSACAEARLDAVRNREVKIIPLSYANVGETSMSFQGEKVAVPGIQETLMALLSGSRETSPDNGAAKAEATDPAAKAPPADNCMPTPAITIDRRTNSVIVEGAPKAIERVEAIIERLDRPVDMIELEVMIVQAAAGTSKSLGVQWAIARKNGDKADASRIYGMSTGSQAGQAVADAAQLTYQNLYNNQKTTDVAANGTEVVNQNAPEIDPISLLPLTGGSDLLASYIYRGSRVFFEAQINALDEQNKAQILSSPRVMTLNNIAAKITSTRKINLPVVTGDGTNADIKSVDAGLEMDITPSVIPDETSGELSLVRLSVNAKNASFTGQLETSEKEVQTQVIVPDGATFVLGGLFESTRAEGQSGVPGLQEIPLLGGLFRDRSASDERTETIFFITPRVINQRHLAAQGIGTRAYMMEQRERLARDRVKLQEESRLLNVSSALEEDE